MAGLEASSGVLRFEQAGQVLELNDVGRDLFDTLQDLGAAAWRIALVVAGRSQALEVRVTISASDAIAVYFLTPLQPELQANAPGIEVEVVASTTISDWQRREGDIAVRHFRPVEPELIWRKVGELRVRPLVPEDLARG